MKSLVFAPFLACALLTMPAWGQAASPQVAIPKNTCEKPDDYPGRLASDTVIKGWTKSMSTYVDCIKKYVADQKTIADAATKSANEAVEEYNAVASKAKEATEKAKANN
jgi:hypothetical protein